MTIDNELRKKLFEAGSREEVEALLQGRADEEEIRTMWESIERKRGAADLEELDDDELETVSGGWIRDFLEDGCYASVAYNSSCSTADACVLAHMVYWNGGAICVGGKERHVWEVSEREKHDRYGSYTVEVWTCTKCGKVEEV